MLALWATATANAVSVDPSNRYYRDGSGNPIFFIGYYQPDKVCRRRFGPKKSRIAALEQVFDLKTEQSECRDTAKRQFADVA